MQTKPFAYILASHLKGEKGLFKWKLKMAHNCHWGIQINNTMTIEYVEIGQGTLHDEHKEHFIISLGGGGRSR